MQTRSQLVGLVMVLVPAIAHAEVQAPFLGASTYATKAGCMKLKKLAAGTPRNLNSVPDTLDAKGHSSWEGGCMIDKITERLAGKSWVVQLKCSEGAIENAKTTETWTKAPDGSILVKSSGGSTRFYACDVRGAKTR